MMHAYKVYLLSSFWKLIENLLGLKPNWHYPLPRANVTNINENGKKTQNNCGVNPLFQWTLTRHSTKYMEYERKSECVRKDFWLKMFEKANKNVSTFPIDKHVLWAVKTKKNFSISNMNM